MINNKACYRYFFVLALIIFGLEAFGNAENNFWVLRQVQIFDLLLIASYLIVKIYNFLKHKQEINYLFIALIIMLLFMPRLAAFLVILEIIFSSFIKFLSTPRGEFLIAKLKMSPSRVLALSFLGLIGIGTILLMLPAASKNGHALQFINALFTMTSASCLVGFNIYNFGFDFSRFGQGVILLGMQSGGLVIMILSSAFAALVGGKIASRKNNIHREVLDITTAEDLIILIKSVMYIVFTIEFIGSFLFFICWSKDIPRIADRVWWSIFHAVSAFCNAGLSLFPNSLEFFVNRPEICILEILLVTLGALGFFVLLDLSRAQVWEIKRPKAIWERLQIQTKVVLISFFILDAAGLLFFLFFEYNNSLLGLSIPNKIIAALFSVVNLRSGGFSVVPLSHIAGPTIVLALIYMFIGGAPSSTSGGIKVSTAAIILMSLRAMLHGRQDVELCGRRLTPSLINRSVSIVLVAAMALTFFLILLLATQVTKFDAILFETVSAFATVGLTLDATSNLNDTGKILMVALMYVGRIAPLTLAMAIGERRILSKYRLAVGHIAVG